MAIDRDAIIKDVYLGAGAKATTLIPPTMWSYDDKIADVPHDPEKAKAMLAAAGVHAPLDIDLWYQPVSRPYNPNGKRIGEMMQADLAKIGVNAKLVTYEWGEYRKRIEDGEDMTGQMGWTGDNGDPDNFFFLLACPDGSRARTISRSGATPSSMTFSSRRGGSPTRRSAPSSISACRKSSTTRRRSCSSPIRSFSKPCAPTSRATSRARSARMRSRGWTSSRVASGCGRNGRSRPFSQPPCSLIFCAASP